MRVLLLYSTLAASAALCDIPVGTAIERAPTAAALLTAAARIPTGSSGHLSQDVHQLKRQQLASNALGRLSKLLIGSGAREERYEALRDERLSFLLQAAAEPSCARADGIEPKLDEQSARSVSRSLEALATLCAADVADNQFQSSDDLAPLLDGAVALANRAESLAPSLTLSEAASSRWASKRLLGNYVDTTALDTIAASLPFDFYPGSIALPLPERLGGSTSGTMSILPSMADLLRALDVDALRAGVPFEQAALLTADGRTVRERRHTAWLAEEGIGALAYSGKLMNPSPLDACEAVRALRDGLHKDCGERFDCALANLYVEGGQAACAWHRDPEHGDEIDLRAKWARPTYVVSAGETRRFAFRPYRQPGEPPAAEDERHAIALFSGDVIAMDGDCNDLFEHCVLPGQGDKNEGARVSLVFKRALVGRDGKRGHTLEGQGRRARARARQGSEEEKEERARRLKRGLARGRGGGRGAGRGRRAAASKSRPRRV